MFNFAPASRVPAFGVRLGLSAIAALVFSLASAAPGLAARQQKVPQWEDAGQGAIALLPAPSRAKTIIGGNLACAEQRWTLRLEANEPLPANVDARVTIDGAAYPGSFEQTATSIALPVSGETLEALKSGSSLTVKFGTKKSSPSATFSLRKSRRAIEAITPRCSPINVEGFNQMVFSDTTPAIDIAKELVADEAKAFRAATSREPEITAAYFLPGGGREVLFTKLCGSDWYGSSGCTVLGFLRYPPGREWKQIYNTEGMAMFLDPKASSDGLPNLVTIDPNMAEPEHWKWDGMEYAVTDERSTEDPIVAIDHVHGEQTMPN